MFFSMPLPECNELWHFYNYCSSFRVTSPFFFSVCFSEMQDSMVWVEQLHIVATNSQLFTVLRCSSHSKNNLQQGAQIYLVLFWISEDCHKRNKRSKLEDSCLLFLGRTKLSTFSCKCVKRGFVSCPYYYNTIECGIWHLQKKFNHFNIITKVTPKLIKHCSIWHLCLVYLQSPFWR